MDGCTYGRTFETGFIRSTLSKSRPNKLNTAKYSSVVIEQSIGLLTSYYGRRLSLLADASVDEQHPPHHLD